MRIASALILTGALLPSPCIAQEAPAPTVGLLDSKVAAAERTTLAIERWEARSGVGVSPDVRERLVIETGETLAKAANANRLPATEGGLVVDGAVDQYLSAQAAGRTPRYKSVLRGSVVAMAARPPPTAGGTSGGRTSYVEAAPAGFNPLRMLLPIEETWTLLLDAAPGEVEFRINNVLRTRSTKDQYLMAKTTADVFLKAASGFVCQVQIRYDSADKTARCRQR